MAYDYRKDYQRYSQYYLKNSKILYAQPLTQKTLSIILSLFAICFFALVALRPTILTISNLFKEIETKKQTEQKLDNKIQQLEGAQVALDESSKFTDLVNNSLPSQADFDRIEREIEWLAYQNNLVIKEENFDKFDLYGEFTDENDVDIEIVPSDPNGISMAFGLFLGGSYLDLKKFSDQLEKLDRIVIIDSLDFNKESEIEGAELQLKIRGKVYYMPKA